MTSVTASFELAAGDIPIKVNKIITEYIINAHCIVSPRYRRYRMQDQTVGVSVMSHVLDVKRSTENDYFDIVR